MNRTRQVALLIVLATGIVAVALRQRWPGDQDPRPPSSLPKPAIRDDESPSLGELATFLGRLQETDRSHNLQAARSIRALLARQEGSFELLVARLRDSGCDLRERRAVAVILGSFPGGRGRQEILRALREGALKGIERSAILALGIRTLDDEREFARDGLPYAVEAAEGLVVYVRDPIADPEIRREVLGCLSEAADPSVRRASSLVLRDSVSFPEVREAFLKRVGTERDPETAAEGAAALGAWARQAAPQEEDRGRIVGRLTDVVGDSDELFRFRLLTALGEVSMTNSESTRLRSLLDAPDPDVRAFAADVLGRRSEFHPGRDAELLPRLIRVLATDSNDSVRETAALALRHVGGDPQAKAALIQALQSDPHWGVRAAAARALESHQSAEALTALRQAVEVDPRLEVRQSATRTLATLAK